MPKKKSDRLTSVLGEVETILKRQNSLRYIFLQGLMRGVGTTLGATVFVALITSITLHFADSEATSAFMQALGKSLFSQ